MTEAETTVEEPQVVGVADEVGNELAIIVADVGGSSKSNEIPTFDLGIPATQLTNPIVVDDTNAKAVGRASPRAKRKVMPGLALRSPYTEISRQVVVNEEDEEMSAFIWSYKKSKNVIAVDDGECKLEIKFLQDLSGRGWFSSKYVGSFVNFLNFEHLDAIPRPGDDGVRKPTRMWFHPYILEQTAPTRRSKNTNVIQSSIQSHPQLRHLTVILDDVKMFFMPCIFNSHWRLFVVNMESRRLQYLDSLSNGYSEVTIQAEKSLRLVDQYFDNIGKSVGASTFEVTIENVPQQDDLFSCGVLMCKLMQCWNGHENPIWSLEWPKSSSLLSFRKQLCACVVLYDGNKLCDSWRAELVRSKLPAQADGKKGQRIQHKRNRVRFGGV